MGRYINWDDVVNRYPTVSELGTGEVNTPFIVPSEFELDSMLAPKFTLPFSVNNYTVSDLAIDLTYSKLIMRVQPDLAKAVKSDVTSRVSMLLEGTQIMLTTSGTRVEVPGNTFHSTSEDYAPTFGVGDVADMHVSSAQLYDEEQDRG